MEANIAMAKPCCVGGIKKADGLKGKEDKAGDWAIYVSTPASPNGKAIVIVHDIFGWGIPNTRVVADKYADEGYYAVVPDLYAGDYWPFDISKEENALSQPKFGEWFGKYSGGEGLEKVLTGVEASIDFAAKTCPGAVALAGSCWGGMIVHISAGKFAAKLKAAATFHPVGCDDTTPAKMPIPVAFIFGEIDDFVKADMQAKMVEACKDTKCMTHTFPGMVHGFAVRPYDEASQAAAEEAHKMGFEFLAKNM
eukprot:CAMPEP_0206233250 /NCGR_PEP_ID=MMETSP0047_2-20121206/11881_1 /ASSEMBLY_ACC=CAM_ASM_000192 /TAXON_ID=195065 /ORGANISM="Chroomonas mesostigmatica_cf, Strain CCMP1168" /LENGTH=251 /DNA_ID=CAMNT_0053657105 /DNA_START=47 /DNA_END=802 /DNA_ORIENTATION=+